MKKLNTTWEGINDTTGYLFSFAKSFSAAVKNSPYSELSEDIVATSGFAFRMWISADLCPSETSMWDFGKQPTWILNGGLETTFAGCFWQPDDVSEQARLDVMPLIKKSINNGIPVIAWDIGVLEWGLITGYDDETQKFSTLCINGSTDDMDYTTLGKREMPMLNVVTITGKTDKPQNEIILDTLRLAKSHLWGEEWCENAQGLAAYQRLINFFEMDNTEFAVCWSMEYALGTFGALKWYAWKFFEKYNLGELAGLYKTVYESWQKAFDMKKTADINLKENRQAIADLLKTAEECEKKAVELM
jgi:hypothetical protein